MKFRIISLIMVFLVLAGSYGYASGRSLIYQSITKGVAVTINEKIEINGAETIVTSSSIDQGTNRVRNRDNSALVWELVNDRTDTRLTAERVGDIIKLEGKFEGKTVDKTLKIDGKPWFQAWDLSLGSFVLSGKKSLEFWTVRNDLKAFRMAAFRDKEETLEINGRNVEAVKVKVSLPGWMAKFWSASYWFRKSDGVFVKYQGANGPPGTPETVIELVNE